LSDQEAIRVLRAKDTAIFSLAWPRGHRRMLEVNLKTAPLRLDLRALDGQDFGFSQIGGHAKWFEICEQSIARLAELNAAASARPNSLPRPAAIEPRVRGTAPLRREVTEP
jgi:hypothetical protein